MGRTEADYDERAITLEEANDAIAKAASRRRDRAPPSRPDWEQRRALASSGASKPMVPPIGPQPPSALAPARPRQRIHPDPVTIGRQTLGAFTQEIAGSNPAGGTYLLTRRNAWKTYRHAGGRLGRAGEDPRRSPRSASNAAAARPLALPHGTCWSAVRGRALCEAHNSTVGGAREDDDAALLCGSRDLIEVGSKVVMVRLRSLQARRKSRVSDVVSTPTSP